MFLFDGLIECSVAEVKHLFERHHGYKSIGNVAVYCFAYVENSVPVAAYAWQPPAPGAAKSVCPEEPQAVLALSRMVAVPKSQRELKHISKPLRQQMKKLIDRTRYPVLVTYSDEGQGHTGHVYKCSGWKKTTKSCVKYYEDECNRRISVYVAGGNRKDARLAGRTTIQRWEHWACEKGSARHWMESHGWRKVAIPKVWKSGSQAYSYRKLITSK